MGRQQGRALLNLLISLLWQEKEEGRHKEPPQLCQAVQESIYLGWSGKECSISALPGNAAVIKHFFFPPSVSAGTPPCANEAL